MCGNQNSLAFAQVSANIGVEIRQQTFNNILEAFCLGHISAQALITRVVGLRKLIIVINRWWWHIK